MRMLSALGFGGAAVAVDVGVSISLLNVLAIAAARKLRRDRECADVKGFNQEREAIFLY